MLEQEQADTAAEDQLCQDQVVQQYFNTHELTHSSDLSSSCDPDFVQLGGSSELDSSRLETSQTLCGEQSRPGKGLTVLCGSSTVRYDQQFVDDDDDDDDDDDRLVSGGEYDNSVTVLVKAATDADLDFDNNLVMTCPEFLGNA